MSLHDIRTKWWPEAAKREEWESRLAQFYATNDAYHAMTAGGDKRTHPQVQYLLERVVAGNVYAEVGCGGGLVSGLVAERGATVHGFDISPIAIANAARKCLGSNVSFSVASADAIPLADNSLDGAWSFEMLEHVWDPVAVLKEMVRIVKPGGFLFVTCPNHFSLDLHLQKKPLVRMAELVVACLRYGQDCLLNNKFFVNLVPDIVRDDVYPDCDMISSLIPCRLPMLVRAVGCEVEVLSMFRMVAGHDCYRDMLRYDSVPILRWFGDHVFLWMKKSGGV